MTELALNISTTLDASKHTLNTSESKQKFSFSKSSRFHNSRQKSLCDSIYDIPNTRSIRSTSFGYGNKVIGPKIDKNKPQPATYTLSSSFEEKNKGATFGEGRQKLQLGGPLRESILRKFVPGPGKYDSAYSTLNVPPISMKSRIPDKSLDHLKKVPGPGAYNHQQIGTNKYYVQSKYSYSGGPRITPGKRLEPINRSVSVGPGQCTYFFRLDESKTIEINAEGRYPISKFENSKSRIFSKSKREELVNKNQIKTPGPGNYSTFSSFG